MEASMNELNDHKVIRNRNIVKQVDHKSTLELRWWILVLVLFAALMCVYSWQQHRMLEYGYRIEALKKESTQLEKARRKLYLEQAQLESPARIFQLAHEKLGMSAPQSHQVIFETAVGPSWNQRRESLAWDLNSQNRISKTVNEIVRTP
jgi:cell division protein FtsL